MAAARSRWDVLALAAVSALALVVFRIDTALYRAFARTAPPIALLADLRLSSILVILGLVVATSARAKLQAPMRPDRELLLWCAAWLAGAFVSVHFFGVGRVPLPRWQDVVAFSVTGPVAEELLVRGLVLSAAERVWPNATARPRTAVLVSAVVFSLMHAQYHAHLDQAFWMQAAWTLPLGILLGWLASRCRSVWPALGVHWANNALVLWA